MTLTATVEPAAKNVLLAYTSPGGSPATLTVTRTGPSGTAATVRGYSRTAPAGSQSIRDFEAPIGVPLVYTLTDYDTAGTAIHTETISTTVPGGECDMWMTDLARAGNTLRVIVESLAQLEFTVPATVHEIITRRDPIITTDIAHTPALELLFLTGTLGERDQARAMLGNGIPVLLRTPPEDGIGNLYLGVLGYTEQRIVSPSRAQDRRFTVTARQVARPDPALYEPVGVAQYSHVKETFVSYGALLGGRASYDAVLYDWTGSAPVDIVPWPPEDV